MFEARTNLEKNPALGGLNRNSKPDFNRNPNRVYRLDRMRALCRAFDDPQDHVPAVHIAGSKGKGSTAAFIAALIARGESRGKPGEGRKVGVYSSPHLIDYRERFRITGAPFPEEEALRTAALLMERLPIIERSLPGEGGATTFELLTLFAFLLFRETSCDFAVLETGLGGRLDATNVIKNPLLTVITPIEMEHVEILGPRLTDIAGEKAGIIKMGTPVWSAEQKPAVRRRLRRRAEQLKSPFFHLGSYLRSLEPAAPDNNPFRWTLKWRSAPAEHLELKMGGRFQAENAALALAAVRSMGGEFARIDASRTADAELPGRFQILREAPPIIIDGAHTLRSARGLARAFRSLTAAEYPADPLLVFGCAEGKDHPGMARVLCGGRNPVFREVIVTTPGTFKPSSPPEVAESFRRRGAAVSLIPDTRRAWSSALARAGDTRGVLVTGSFFMAGAVFALWTEHRGT